MARRQQDGINEAAADAVRGAVGHMLRVLMENLETKSRTYKNKVCNASPLPQLSCALCIQDIGALHIVPRSGLFPARGCFRYTGGPSPSCGLGCHTLA